MANTRSARKAQRQAERRAARNLPIRSAVKTHIKKARTALDQAGTEAAEVVRDAISALDRAARKGIIHPNNAARHKARLAAQLKARQTAAA